METRHSPCAAATAAVDALPRAAVAAAPPRTWRRGACAHQGGADLHQRRSLPNGAAVRTGVDVGEEHAQDVGEQGEPSLWNAVAHS